LHQIILASPGAVRREFEVFIPIYTKYFEMCSKHTLEAAARLFYSKLVDKLQRMLRVGR
jgi:hypothetical protein